MIIPFIILLLQHPYRLSVFLAATVPGILVLNISSRQKRTLALPIFPLYILIQIISYSLPLFGAELHVDAGLVVTPDLLARCVIPIALWFIAIWVGWLITPSKLLSSRSALDLTQSFQGKWWLPHSLFLVCFLIQVFLGSSLFWYLGGGFPQSLVQPLRAVALMTSVIGAFWGAILWARGFLKYSWLWFLLFAAIFYQGLASLLLSSNQALLIAALLGIWLGRSRQALFVTVLSVLFISFLHGGKYQLRDRYWGSGMAPPSNPIVFAQEWLSASLAPQSQLQQHSSSDLFTQRFNNLANLLWVQNELASGTPVLGGASLMVIPETLTPRFLSPTKVRSQEGQVLLNLHFGRQNSREATESAYIAWGFLSEGVGNFGSFFGPLLLGVLTGCMIALSENIGRSQPVLSTPGMISLSLFIYWSTAYETNLSTFAASSLQLIMAVIGLSFFLSPGSNGISKSVSN